MRSWIHISKGRVLRQAHTGLKELGGLLEDEYGRKGFSGRVAELYRKNEPIGWTRMEGTLRPWDIDGNALAVDDHTDPRGAPLAIFYNPDVVISVSRRTAAMSYAFRNANGDELYFVHRGSGTIYTEFGPIPYVEGDYVLLPKGITYRVAPNSKDSFFLIIETVDEIALADLGPIGRQAPFDPTLLYVPEPEEDPRGATPATKEGEYELRVKHGDEHTSFFYPFDPMDVVGWKGDLFPFRFNIRDYLPIMSDRIHLMPSAARIFEARGVVICNILPRPMESDPKAEIYPPYHRNVDYDEMMLVHGGTLLGAEMAKGSLTLVPQCVHHGLPQALQKVVNTNRKKFTVFDAQLIMVDTVRPLKVTEQAKTGARSGDQIREGNLA